MGDLSVKDATALVKAVSEIVHGEQKPASRPGPLALAARLYLSLAIILAVSISVAMVTGHGEDPPDGIPIVAISRLVLLVVIVFGIAVATWVVRALYKKNAALLFSPTELTETVQRDVWVPKSGIGTGNESTNADAKANTKRLQTSAPPIPDPKKNELEPAEKPIEK